jgi:acetolactate synthase regulatory subunit
VIAVAAGADRKHCAHFAGIGAFGATLGAMTVAVPSFARDSRGFGLPSPMPRWCGLLLCIAPTCVGCAGSDAPCGARLGDRATVEPRWELRREIDAAAEPWTDASSALSLLRDSGEARALVPQSMQPLGSPAAGPLNIQYALDPVALRTDEDREDARILRVTERLSRGFESSAVESSEVESSAVESSAVESLAGAADPHMARRAWVERRFVLEGLASGRTVVVDVPLRGAAGTEREQDIGAASKVFVNGAPVEAPLGASHLSIELARDEATVVRLVRIVRARPAR